MTVSGRILVTGATGFIGVRLCERLALETGASVRALARQWSSAVRIAHLPVEIVLGDVTDPVSLGPAISGCNAVVHLALGSDRGIGLGTRQLVAAAHEARVRRFVHMSSTAVYGLNPRHPVAGEATPLERLGQAYGDAKIRAERAVWAAVARGLPAVVLRPCIVWGPRSQWNTGVLKRLQGGQISLVGDGRGICNSVYIDNLIDAVLASLVRPEAVGEAFFVTDAKPVTWGEFVAAHAALLTPRPVIQEIAAEEVAAYWRAQPGQFEASVRAFGRMLTSLDQRKLLRTVPVFDRMLAGLAERLPAAQKARIRTLVGAPGGGLLSKPAVPDAGMGLIQACQVTFSSEKAARMLGYAPRVSFVDGMARTAEWFAWAGAIS
jgi:nucleoside-diphosphate-sugar epimerase